MAVISKGITLAVKKDGSQFTNLKGLQEIPDLGGETESIEITTLADSAHMYEEGLKNYGDSLDFKFLYDDGTEFFSLQAVKNAVEWKVTLPDGTNCTFTGKCSVRLDGVGVAAALTFTLSVKPQTEMVWSQS